jgi:hypothetical protein
LFAFLSLSHDSSLDLSLEAPKQKPNPKILSLAIYISLQVPEGKEGGDLSFDILFNLQLFFLLEKLPYFIIFHL